MASEAGDCREIGRCTRRRRRRARIFAAFKPLVAIGDALRHHRRAAVHGAGGVGRGGGGTAIAIAAQDVLLGKPEGAFTGEISPRCWWRRGAAR